MSEAAWEDAHPAVGKEVQADQLDAEADDLEAQAAVVEAPEEESDLGSPGVRPAGKPFEPSTMPSAAERTVNYRVVDGQRVESFVYQGVTLTTEWTAVPAQRLSDIVAAAANAGVKIEAEVV